MNRRLVARVLPALLALAIAVPAVAQPPFRWWRSENIQKDLALTTEQIARLDEIFRSTLEQQRQNKDRLDQLEERLSTMIEADAAEAEVVQQVDKVEAARAALNKERTLMLLHMRKVLTPEQRTTYNARVEAWQREHARTRNDNTRGQR
jgi:Spy/CpxP family protein refolding chaperone